MSQSAKNAPEAVLQLVKLLKGLRISCQSRYDPVVTWLNHDKTALYINTLLLPGGIDFTESASSQIEVMGNDAQSYMCESFLLRRDAVNHHCSL